MTKPIYVLVNGAAGKMGQQATQAIQRAEGLELVGAIGKQDDLRTAIKESSAQVVVDFTTATSAFDNACHIIAAGVHPVIGTSGLAADQVQQLAQRCAQKKLGGLVVPNFAIGAVLALQYAQNCARYFPAVEIIEMHHNKKADAPSGTAIRAAELIAQVKAKASINPAEYEILPGARGATYQDIPIHSIRLPGLLAHQMVMFSDLGEVLTIKHDIFSREAYMPGVCLACRKVVELDTLLHGLEHIL